MDNLITTLNSYGQYSWNAPSWFGPLVIIAIIWTLVWKGMAMWKAAKRNEKAWFIVILIVNTIGILDILYLYLFSRKPKQQI